jgi:hypothetical protein
VRRIKLNRLCFLVVLMFVMYLERERKVVSGTPILIILAVKQCMYIEVRPIRMDIRCMEDVNSRCWFVLCWFCKPNWCC